MYVQYIFASDFCFSLVAEELIVSKEFYQQTRTPLVRFIILGLIRVFDKSGILYLSEAVLFDFIVMLSSLVFGLSHFRSLHTGSGGVMVWLFS